MDDSRPPRLDHTARAPPPAAETRAPPRSQLLLAVQTFTRAPPRGQQRGEGAEPSRSASSTAARAPPLAAVSTGAPRASPPAACGRSLSGSCSGSKRKRKNKRIDFDRSDFDRSVAQRSASSRAARAAPPAAGGVEAFGPEPISSSPRAAANALQPPAELDTFDTFQLPAIFEWDEQTFSFDDFCVLVAAVVDAGEVPQPEDEAALQHLRDQLNGLLPERMHLRVVQACATVSASQVRKLAGRATRESLSPAFVAQKVVKLFLIQHFGGRNGGSSAVRDRLQQLRRPGQQAQQLHPQPQPAAGQQVLLVTSSIRSC